MQPDGGLLGGRYQLTAPIATGGMGQVWRGRDTVLDRDVAVKVLRSEYTDDPTFRARFRAEAQLAAGLLHPNIATLFDYGEVPPRGATGELLAYLVMELVRGESLSVLLRRERRLPVDRTLDVLRQSAAGLAAAHAAGVVHRDVKPGNVLLADDGRVKLTDFGVAVSAASVQLTRTGEVIGTAAYLAPEQVEGAKAAPGSDVYALGLVGYECLAGHAGYAGESMVQVALARTRQQPPPLPADVPGPVRELIERAIARDPAQRFVDGAALLAAVDDVRAGRPIAGPATGPTRTTDLPAVPAPAPAPATRQTPPPPATRVMHLPAAAAGAEPEPAAEERRRRRWPLLLAALAVLLVVGGVTAGLLQLTGGRDGSAATPSTPSTSAPPASSSAPAVQLVSVSAADYVGEQVDDVEADLVERGLQVTRRPLQTADAPDGSVISVDPAGQLLPGSTVTVTYAVAPPKPTPTASPTPTPVQPGAGDGKGKGDDKGRGKKDKDG